VQIFARGGTKGLQFFTNYYNDDGNFVINTDDPFTEPPGLMPVTAFAPALSVSGTGGGSFSRTWYEN
jgi:hypothetical protein